MTSEINTSPHAMLMKKRAEIAQTFDDVATSLKSTINAWKKNPKVDTRKMTDALQGHPALERAQTLRDR